ncbi:PDZ domain-containing protein [Mucilaginibacter robiniae]|uniref:PDZ domain-containing protein n=2 Tax=Mucilaginibacter robiniae TaxID=2728022 RepID=A0A7L5E5K9_9SPHI|nr:PDZ domain-containing protein [Mucilaginibacter robiniae]
MERSFHAVAFRDTTGKISLVTGGSRDADSGAAVYPNLTHAAAIASSQVVHIKVTMSEQASASGIAVPRYYGPRRQTAPVMASGSGVVLSQDGYIITNNHVVEDASRMQVVLTDKRNYTAKLIGRDPNTDLALIKINAQGLNPVKLGNSDQVEIGQWVLAIGYPFSLNTTVTAGIVSAKERSIGIIGHHEDEQQNSDRGASAIEAYIQTDAAINPGNSGGALVNTKGELIGINAAIASQTGGYEGYGFAIPVNLVRKIVDDLRRYGTVKRGYLGVVFPSPVTEEQALAERGISPGSINGVYITGVRPGSAAAVAGLKEGDIIQQIDGHALNSSVELSERIARHHPDDRVTLAYSRKGKSTTTAAILKGEAAATRNTATEEAGLNDIYHKLGARFAPLDGQQKQRYQIGSGMLVTAIAPGGFFEQIGIQPGAIVVNVNGIQVNDPVQLAKALTAAASGTIRIACIAPDGSRIMFNLSLGT